jgi:hypothetical protein
MRRASRDISYPKRFFDLFRRWIRKRRVSGLFFVVGAAQQRWQRQNSVFLRCATTPRAAGERSLAGFSCAGRRFQPPGGASAIRRA